MGNRGNYGVFLMLGRLSPIPCGQTPPSPQIGRAATIPQNGPPAPTGRHEPPKSHSKCRHPAHKRRSRRAFGSIHAPSGALRRGPSTLRQTSATDGPGAGRRRKRRTEGCGRLRPGTGPGGEGILPSHAPQGALVRRWTSPHFSPALYCGRRCTRCGCAGARASCGRIRASYGRVRSSRLDIVRSYAFAVFRRASWHACARSHSGASSPSLRGLVRNAG